MNSPSDPPYAVKGGAAKDEKKNAQEIVNYLEDYMLPAPHNKGIISVSTWKDDPTTTIKWQEEKAIYQIKTRSAIDALKMAVSMK